MCQGLLRCHTFDKISCAHGLAACMRWKVDNDRELGGLGGKAKTGDWFYYLFDFGWSK